jgi:hypothetical protein
MSIIARILSPFEIARLWLTYLPEEAPTMNTKIGSMILPLKGKFWPGRTVGLRSSRQWPYNIKEAKFKIPAI